MEHEPMPEQQELAKKYEQEIAAFRELLSALRAVSDLSRAERGGVAFTIEDFKDTTPDSWKEWLERFRQELQAVETKEGVAGLTWRMANEIERRYDAFLERQMVTEKDPVRKKNMELVRGMMNDGRQCAEQAYKAGRRVPMGSVVAEHLPEWYQVA